MAEDRLISAKEFKRFLCGCCNVLNGGEPCEPAECNVMLVIDQQPTIDAVEVVRCKDCEFWNDGWFPECTMGKCKRGKPVLTEPHHYCSYGVRRLDVPVIIKDESFVVKEETKK